MFRKIWEAKDFIESCISLIFLFIFTLFAPFFAFLLVAMALSGAVYGPRVDLTNIVGLIVTALFLALTAGVAILVVKAASFAMRYWEERAFPLIGATWKLGNSNQPSPKSEIDTPLTLRIALSLPKMPLFVAIPIALWWTAHGLLVNVISIACQYDFPGSDRLGLIKSPGNPMPWPMGLLVDVGVTLALDIPATIFLFMAVGSIWPSEKLLRRLWAIRYWFCLAIAIGSWLPSIIQLFR